MTRGEVTVRKTTELLYDDDDEIAVTPRLAMTIRQFCKSHGFSVAMFFKMKAEGRGPVEMKIGRRRLITCEEAKKWRIERVAASKLELT